MCEIVFHLHVEFYYRLSLILEQKYCDTDKSTTRGIFVIAINDNKKIITINYRDNAHHCRYLTLTVDKQICATSVHWVQHSQESLVFLSGRALIGTLS